MDEVLFNGVSEHKLFYNQPVEVRVWCEGLEYQLDLDSYSPLTARCRLWKLFRYVSFRLFNNAIKL